VGIFSEPTMLKQRTVKSEIKIKGKGLHTGKATNVTIRPAPKNKGIIFRRIDLKDMPSVKAIPLNIKETKRHLQRTSIKKGKAEVHTIEHLLAVFNGLGIDNAYVDVDNAEMPGLDGSGKKFADLLLTTGSVRQNADKKFINLKKRLCLEENGASIEIIPDKRLIIDYYLEPKKRNFKNQVFSIKAETPSDFVRFFRKEVAPSRTFCFLRDAIAARIFGLGKGANFKNTLIMWKKKPLWNNFRFSNELARHKMLDLLGDLYLLGGHLRGHIIARKSGHKLNTALVKKIASSLRRRKG